MLTNNVMKIFYILFYLGIILITSLLYIRFNEIKDRHHMQINHFTEIISNYVNRSFLQEEMLLDSLTRELLENDNYKNSDTSKQLLDVFLKQNKNLAGFGIFDLDGNLNTISSNVNITGKVNLLKNKRTIDSFIETLASKNMIIGRTYYFKPLKEWVIPLRKAAYDKYGNILFVITSAFKNNKNDYYLDDLKLSKSKVVAIIKDFDSNNNIYRLYNSSKDITNEKLYNQAIPKILINSIERKIQEKYNFSINTLRENSQTITFEMLAFGDERIAGLRYDEDYHLWVLVQSKKSEVWDEFFTVLLVYTSLFILTFILFFILFKNIAMSNQRIIEKELLLFEQSKMAMMGTMIENIAHQWKQPLNTISAISLNIQIEQKLDILKTDSINDAFKGIEDQVMYLSDTINTFKNYIKENKEFKEVILQDRIAIALNISKVVLKDNGIKLINDIDKRPILIKLVTGELSEVIINILNNSKDILLEKKIKKPWIKLDLEQMNNKIIISIEDNGGGIPKNILTKIFDEYFTTKHEDLGTGIGLYMCNKIVTESLNGKLYAQNTKNGAKFFIELPLNR